MELKELNKILVNLQYPNNKSLRFVEKQTVKEIDNRYDGEQGEEGLYYNIYEVVGQKDVFLKIEMYTDSYGGNDAVRGVQFVAPKPVQKIEYTPI